MFNFKCKEHYDEDILKQCVEDGVYDVIHINDDRIVLVRELEPNRYQTL